MANNISVLDSNSAAQTVKTTDDSGVHTPHQNAQLQVGGSDVDSSNPVPVQAAGTSVTVKRAAVSLSSSGSLDAALASNKIKVLGLFLMVDADIDVEINDGSGGSALIGELSLSSDGHGFVLPVATAGSHWIETSVNTALHATITGTGNLSGVVVYHEEA